MPTKQIKERFQERLTRERFQKRLTRGTFKALEDEIRGLFLSSS